MAWARSSIFSLGLSVLAMLAAASAARAEYRLCNQTGYILDVALAIEASGGTATQGWFRVLPGSCSAVLSGAAEGERFFVHTRTPPAYGETPEAADVSRMFCVLPGNFLLPGADYCGKSGGSLVPFTEVAAKRDGDTATTVLTDGTAASPEAAREAALARLLKLAGYDPGRNKTRDALRAFKKAHGLSPSAIDEEALFGALYRAAEEAGKADRDTGMKNKAEAE